MGEGETKITLLPYNQWKSKKGEMKNCRQEDSGECETNMMGPPRYDVESQSHKNIIIHIPTLCLLKK